MTERDVIEFLIEQIYSMVTGSEFDYELAKSVLDEVNINLDDWFQP
jgi:hypothetical protein